LNCLTISGFINIHRLLTEYLDPIKLEGELLFSQNQGVSGLDRISSVN